MKLNIFKIENTLSEDLCKKLIDSGYSIEADLHEGNYQMTFYIQRKSAISKGWLDFYKEILMQESYDYYSNNLGSESASGVYLIRNKFYTYAIVNGYAHFIVRKYCDKDFGLNLAERIINTEGLKMKHSQTFTSARKKDITAYSQKKKVGDTFEYGEAFSYLKCKSVDKDMWGDTVDFGESARFTFSKEWGISAKNIFLFIDQIHTQLLKDALVKLPRYQKVVDKEIKRYLNIELNKRFLDIINDVEIEEYWLSGVSFNFSNDFRYVIKKRGQELSEKINHLDIETIKKILLDNQHIVKDDYAAVKVYYYDENDKCVGSSKLLDLLQITCEYDGQYYVYLNNMWVQFSESYVRYIEEQVDGIPFVIKDSMELTESKLIENLVSAGEYEQLHKNNVYIGKYCIEKADLMDSENVVMIKDQRQQADLIYLVKQATTSLRLTKAGELGTNIFKGKNVCLWMLTNRKSLKKLSDFRSFHLLDALNDFKKEVISKNLNPVIWISLKK